MTTSPQDVQKFLEQWKDNLFHDVHHLCHALCEPMHVSQVSLDAHVAACGEGTTAEMVVARSKVCTYDLDKKK